MFIESTISKRLRTLILSMVLALSLPLMTPARSQSGGETQAESIARKVVELTNAARAKEGLSPLTSIEYLHEAARGHSQEMLDLSYFSHTSSTPGLEKPKQRIATAGGWDTELGENIYRSNGFDPAAVAERTVTAWLASPVHRANIMKPSYNSIGVGVANRGEEWVLTQNFAKQCVVVQQYSTVHVGSGLAFTLRAAIRDGSDKGMLFVNGEAKQAFVAVNGVFELKGIVPEGALLAVGQEKAENRFTQTLIFPVNAVLVPGMDVAAAPTH